MVHVIEPASAVATRAVGPEAHPAPSGSRKGTYGTEAVMRRHKRCGTPPELPFLHLDLAICRRKGQEKRRFSVQTGEKVPVLANSGNLSCGPTRAIDPILAKG